MKTRLNIAFLFLGMAVLTGCYYDNEEELYPGGGSCDIQNVTFAGTIKPLIQSRCALPSCHGGAQSPNLSTDQAIQTIAANGDLKARVIDRIPPAMPPGGSLPPCEIKQLELWLESGHPINN